MRWKAVSLALLFLSLNLVSCSQVEEAQAPAGSAAAAYEVLKDEEIKILQEEIARLKEEK